MTVCPTPTNDDRSSGPPVLAEAAPSERAVLGQALQARSDDILQICQRRYFQQLPDLARDPVAEHPMWMVTTVAVTAIANWLQTGNASGPGEREQIASLGHAAIRPVTSVTMDRCPDADPVARRPPPTPTTELPPVPAGALSVAMLTKVNLWWEEATCLVLAEEAACLGISSETLQVATGMVVASCKSSMVQMAKRYDAELADLQDRLTHMALHDPLTGLANRTVLLAHLAKAIRRMERHPSGLAVAFVDLDHFKSTNDVLGHGCGDQLLQAMAARFSSVVRPGDTIARFGGDEFVALFVDLSDPLAEARVLAERLHDAVGDPVEIAGERVYMTASVGVAVVVTPTCRAEEALAEADAAMYGVKRRGRNQIAVVEIGHGSGPIRTTMAGSLYHALARGELRLDYQPIWSLKEGDRVGFEALLRWDHPERGTIAPSDFIPGAEESGLIVTIGTWVMEEACRQGVAWQSRSGKELQMAVNVSGRQLANPSFPATVDEVLAKTGMPPESLVLEITESILLGDHSDYEGVLSAVKRRGVQLSIDDFGTGYSSLAYLRRFRVDQLKVDRSFVKDVSEHRDTRIVEAVVRLAHDLGLEVVAEGVETELELETMRALGCDTAQGFLLGRPGSPESLEQSFVLRPGRPDLLVGAPGVSRVPGNGPVR